MTFSLGFSPCPNDTFIFDALIHHKIDTEGFQFEVSMEDVEELNRKAFDCTLDITKLSFHAYLYVVDHYALLRSGSALGDNVGPLLISKSQTVFTEKKDNIVIAIPGKYTTAHYLLSIAYPHLKHKQEMLFSTIEDAVLSGKVDAGVIIHENRFTYASKGLVKLMDLGEYWYRKTQLPIPLGGIVINRKYPKEIQQKVSRLIRNSIEYAFAKPDSSREFTKTYSQEMSEEVIQKHIDLYVNSYSIDLGKKGEQAIQCMFEKAIEAHFPISLFKSNYLFTY